MSEFVLAVIMGIVEGITEFIPVSSTGHLIVAGDLLKFTGEKAATFEIFIQLGAILAVVVLYFPRFWGLLPFQDQAAAENKGFSGFNGIFLLLLTTFPALLVGFFARKLIKYYLFGPVTVAWALFIGGLGILLAERFMPQTHTADLDNISYKQAFAVGCFQCLALWPGMSRSASTIIGGLIMGLDRKVAAEYSFLAAVPVMVAAVGYDILKEWGSLGASDIWFFGVGFVVSFLSAILAVKFFVTMLQRWSLAPFGWYRILIAPIIYFVMR